MQARGFKRLMLTAWAVILTGCTQVTPASDLPKTVSYPAPSKVPEAYLSLSESSSKAQPAPRRYFSIGSSLLPSPGQSNGEPTPNGDTSQVLLEPFEAEGNTLYRLNGGDYLISRPLEENANAKAAIANRATQMRLLAEKHPGVRFYTYFVTRATNCDWYGKLNNIYTYDYATYFEEQLGSDTRIKSARYVIADLQDYMDTGYKTDFHVNSVGSYRVYQDIYAMLSKDMPLSPMLPPLRVMDFSGLRMIGDLFHDKDVAKALLTEEQMDLFEVFAFDYGSYDSFVSDKKMTVGLEEEYAQGMIDRSPTFGHQFSYYGGQTGIVRFEFHQPERPNLLLLSDSQGRPSRKLLASHFNRTVFLDDVQSRSEDIDRIIGENEIGVVILLGQESMFEYYE